MGNTYTQVDANVPVATRVTFWLTIVSLLAIVPIDYRLMAEDFAPLNTQLAGEEPLAPEEAVKRLRVPNGFQVTLSAAEPDVRQPIAITFDDRGRLWVAESYSYDGSTFTDERRDRILIFEDTTGDGVLDRRRLFCERLTHLTGLEIGFGGVWITAPPHLAFMPDRLLDKLSDDQTRDLFAWMMSNGPDPARSRREAHGKLPVVILLGDSIRMNYQQTVVEELKDKAIVWSPEENCRNSAFTLERLERWVKGRNASVVHINVGLHDMFLNATTGQPRHDIEVYCTNLQKIIAKLRELTDARIIFALTTPVDETRQAGSKTYGRVVRRAADVIQYNRAAVKVATAAGIQVNDIHSLSNRVGAEDILRQSDGIHLSKTGDVVIGRHVARVIKSALDEPPTAANPDESDFVSIFNGRDLKGWDGKPGAWEVYDGEIWCTGTSKEKNWLIWRKDQPADFVLRLEFRWDKGNSGVQVRSDDLGQWMVHGYQVEVAQQNVMGLWHHSLLANDHPKKQARHLMATAGQVAFLAEDGSKTVEQSQDAESVKAHFKEHAWQTMEIVASGSKLVQKINGVVFSTVVDRDKAMSRRSGFIALQDHGKGCKVAFRKIRLRRIGSKNDTNRREQKD